MIYLRYFNFKISSQFIYTYITLYSYFPLKYMKAEYRI